ncbi:MAG TPA: rhodanese-like domain-containing protein, partial [Ignavibacteriales bacterium]|nr:rhodanese-like domain-containing protein [Ignavibacteriales bacterium]
WHDIDKMEGILLVDVRTKEEFDKGTINGAINIPMLDIRGRMNELPKNKDIVLFCDNGRDAYTAERMLKQRGYNAKSLSGGYSLYEMFKRKKVTI